MCVFLQLLEVLEMVISYMESKNCKDQIFLLLYEHNYAETLYCLLVEKGFSMQLKQRVLKVLVLVLVLGSLRSPCVSCQSVLS
jgi:hypothetical protein